MNRSGAVSPLRSVVLNFAGAALACGAGWLLLGSFGTDILRGDETLYAEIVLDSRAAGSWLPTVLCSKSVGASLRTGSC